MKRNTDGFFEERKKCTEKADMKKKWIVLAILSLNSSIYQDLKMPKLNTMILWFILSL